MTSPSVQFSDTDLAALSAALVQAGAEELLPRFGKLDQARIVRKASAFDVVTEADDAAERAIIALLHARFPEAVFIGEEAAHRDPGLLDRVGSAELAFVIDPLDGTKNFASSLPLFGVMAAAVSRGEVIAGVIHDPIRGASAMALRGGGAWQEDRVGKRSALRVAAPVPLAEMEGIVGTNFLPEPMRARVAGRLSQLAVTNWFRCAAHEYCLAAAGHCHILFYNRLMPWDHAAGWLIHREAGGFGAHFDGSPYLPVHTSGGLLCAPDRATWGSVREALLG